MLSPVTAFHTQPARYERAVVFLSLILIAGCGRYAPGTMPRTTALSADAAWDGDGAVSPDGKTVAFVSDREDNQLGLWIRPARTGIPKRIARELIGVSRPSWSADGKQVLLTRIDPVTARGTAFLVEAARLLEQPEEAAAAIA